MRKLTGIGSLVAVALAWAPVALAGGYAVPAQDLRPHRSAARAILPLGLRVPGGDLGPLRHVHLHSLWTRFELDLRRDFYDGARALHEQPHGPVGKEPVPSLALEVRF